MFLFNSWSDERECLRFTSEEKGRRDVRVGGDEVALARRARGHGQHLRRHEGHRVLDALVPDLGHVGLVVGVAGQGVLPAEIADVADGGEVVVEAVEGLLVLADDLLEELLLGAVQGTGVLE